jgi:hypothetical protein
MISGFLGYAFGLPVDHLEEGFYSVFSVKELPHIDAGRTQAKTMTGVGVEENGPVVKLLPEHDPGVGYGFVTVFDRSASLTLSARHRPTQSNTCSGDKNDMCNPCARASAVICIIIRTSLLPIVIMKFTGNHRETVHRSLSRATLPSEIFYRFRKSNVNEFRKEASTVNPRHLKTRERDFSPSWSISYRTLADLLAECDVLNLCPELCP